MGEMDYFIALIICTFQESSSLFWIYIDYIDRMGITALEIFADYYSMDYNQFVSFNNIYI